MTDLLNIEELINDGILSLEQEEYDLAINLFNSALIKDPNNDVAHYNKALVLDKQGKYQEAIKGYGETVRINPKFENAFYNRGLIFTRAKNIAKHFQIFQMLLD